MLPIPITIIFLLCNNKKILTVVFLVVTVVDMKRIEFAKKMGVSEETIYYVLRGQRNFKLKNARKAVTLLGGDIEIWMDSTRHDERMMLFNSHG